MGNEVIRRAWDHTAEEEKSLKHMYAYFCNFFGFSDFQESFFHNRDALVGSDSSKKPFMSSLENSNENIRGLEKEVTNYGLKVSDAVKKPYIALGGFEGIRSSMKEGKVENKTAIKPRGYIHKALAHYNPTEIFVSFVCFLRNDTIDETLKRFFVARKSKVDDALTMGANNLHWRANSHQVDSWFLGGDAEYYFNKSSPSLIRAFQINQVYMRGHDKKGCPIVVIRVKEHFGKDCPERDFEKLICMIIEWARIALRPLTEGVTKGSILFDMSGFSLKNADLAAVKFLATAFEANYPESLGAIWIHKAPWVFNAVWKIIRGWLDPVVASKISFTNNVKDLENFVDIKYIPKDLGGNDTFKMKYPEPTPENASEKERDGDYRQLVKNRTYLFLSIIQATIDWINAKDIETSDKYLEIRLKMQIQLANNYIKIDPYLRKPGLYERIGEIGKMSY